MLPKEAPLPTPSNLPFQSARGGSHTSNRISDSRVGLTIPVMRQNGTDTVTVFPVSWPPSIVTVNGGCTNSAEFTDHGCFPAPASAAHAFLSGPFVLASDWAQVAAPRNMKATPIKVTHLMRGVCPFFSNLLRKLYQPPLCLSDTSMYEKLMDTGWCYSYFLLCSSIGRGCTQPLFSNHRLDSPGFCIVFLATISARNQHKNVA